ncbi:hypothetical protein I302_102152 [Kwoniella bestiolae CBS 10118]|uniref:Uncharacterized protein n=1 Tax=Kwoniella bestiolae CBS 10118 TaxID=1296100 RepID=A0AAJ8M724_9TREE
MQSFDPDFMVAIDSKFVLTQGAEDVRWCRCYPGSEDQTDENAKSFNCRVSLWSADPREQHLLRPMNHENVKGSNPWFSQADQDLILAKLPEGSTLDTVKLTQIEVEDSDRFWRHQSVPSEFGFKCVG